MRSNCGRSSGNHRLPRWGRGTERRVAKVKLRGNAPSFTMSLLWLTLVLLWCLAQLWCVFEENVPHTHSLRVIHENDVFSYCDPDAALKIAAFSRRSDGA